MIITELTQGFLWTLGVLGYIGLIVFIVFILTKTIGGRHED